MIWQDSVLSIVSWVFIAALIPTLISAYGFKLRGLNLRTSAAILSIGLGVMATVMATLHLYQAAIPTAAQAVVWALIGGAPENPKKVKKALKRLFKHP